MVQPVYSDACATSSSANEAYGCAGCALPLCFEEVPPIRLKVTVVHTSIGGSMLITCYTPNQESHHRMDFGTWSATRVDRKRPNIYKYEWPYC